MDNFWLLYLISGVFWTAIWMLSANGRRIWAREELAVMIIVGLFMIAAWWVLIAACIADWLKHRR